MMEGTPSTNRDIWSHGSGTQLPDLIFSCLATLLLAPEGSKPIYFSSPWVSDFALLNNRFRQFSSLFPELDSRAEVRFGEFLATASLRMPVRIITVANDVSKNFVNTPVVRQAPAIDVRFAPEEHHEKGILTPWFYVEGSMNVTYHGVYIRGEKITYHAANAREGREKIARAYLEYDRYWGSLR